MYVVDLFVVVVVLQLFGEASIKRQQMFLFQLPPLTHCRKTSGGLPITDEFMMSRYWCDNHLMDFFAFLFLILTFLNDSNRVQVQ